MLLIDFKCSERDCLSSTCGIKKKIRGFKTLIHTFTKRLEYKTVNTTNNKNNNNTKNKSKKH